MMIVFTAAGLVFASVSFRELIRRLRAQRRFERVQGVVLHVKRKLFRPAFRTPPLKPVILNMPVIRFTTRTGENVTFTSETGDSGKISSYSAGKHLPVRYDPLREFVPMIDSGWGMWSPPVMTFLASLGFLAGAALIWFAFGEQIFGP